VGAPPFSEIGIGVDGAGAPGTVVGGKSVEGGRPVVGGRPAGGKPVVGGNPSLGGVAGADDTGTDGAALEFAPASALA